MIPAIKKDQGKPALDLFDPFAFEEVGHVLTFGAAKYGATNWRRGMHIGKVMAGVLRHCFAILRGEYQDPESGYQHAAHAIAGLTFVFTYVREGRTGLSDDRWENDANDS